MDSIFIIKNLDRINRIYFFCFTVSKGNRENKIRLTAETVRALNWQDIRSSAIVDIMTLQ